MPSGVVASALEKGSCENSILFALLEKVDLGLFEDMGWGDCLDGLPPTVRKEVADWLRDWCQVRKDPFPLKMITNTSEQRHRTILLPSSDASHVPSSQDTTPSAPPSPNPPRHIIITVSIPHPHIVFTASLSLPDSSSTGPSQMQMPIAVSGKPLQATLNIKHTDLWAPAAKPKKERAGQKKKKDGEEEEKREFVYTILADPETWLVAGQRRGHFSLPTKQKQKQGEAETAGEEGGHGNRLSIPLSLVPLARSGVALLPTIDIRPILPERRSDADAAAAGPAGAGQGEEEERLHVETDWLSAGESVAVVPDVRSATVGVAVGEALGEKSGLGGLRSVWVEGVGR